MTTDDVTISPNDVTNGVKIFQNVDDAQAKNAINLAKLSANSDGITDKDAFFSAVVALSKHFLYIDWFNEKGGITAATALGQSQTIANPNLNDDNWKKQYDQLVTQYGSANIHFY